MNTKAYNKFLSILNKKQKAKIILLIFLLFFGMILEILGIGLLLPFLEIISDKNITDKYPLLKDIFNYFTIDNYKSQVAFFLILIFIIYLFKALYLVYLSYRQNIFLQNINAYIASKLFKIYLNQPYIEFSKFKKSKLIKHLTSDISFFNTFSNGIISLTTEVGLLIAILLTIIYIDPISALIMGGLFITFSSVFYFFSKTKVAQWGDIRNELIEKDSSISLEGLSGFRELLIFQKFDFFIKNYTSNRLSLSNVQAKMNTLSILPRHYLEFITILVFIIFILFKLNEGINISSLIPTIGIFIAASFKIIPSINKIIIASQNIKFYSNSIDILIKEIGLQKNIKPSGIIDTKKDNFPKQNIQLKNISFSYDNDNVLENLDLLIEIGNSIGFIGKSGEGKSTLIDLISGIITPSNGTISIDSYDYEVMPEFMKNHIGYISQNVFLFDASIAQNITMNSTKYNSTQEKEIINSIKLADLDEMIDKLPSGINTMVGENGINLSGGQRQRIAIARALYKKSKILILDEATSNLDRLTENKIMKSIYKLKGKLTLLIISHRLSLLDNCDAIFEIKSKQLKKIK